MHPERAFDDPIDLSRYRDAYSSAGSQRSGQPEDKLPDGFYDCEVEEARLSRAPSTGNPMVIWRLRVVAGERRGVTASKIRVITDKTLSFLKEDLRRLGLVLNDINDLNARLHETVGRPISIYKKHNPERQWAEVSFVRPHDDQREAPGVQSERLFPDLKTGTDDDLPF
jgi:hypothetical protein